MTDLQTSTHSEVKRLMTEPVQWPRFAHDDEYEVIASFVSNQRHGPFMSQKLYWA